MKTVPVRFYLMLIIILGLSNSANGIDSLKYSFSFNYYRDLSDTYGGGGLLSGEFTISRSWYGASISYGHFQSQPTYIFKIPVEEIDETLEIPIEEMSIMQIGNLSGFIRPIQKKWITTDLVFGIGFGKAQNSCFKGVDYSYNLSENRFTYLYQDYQLIKTNHFGYQAGFNITFYVSQKIGFQFNSRMQHLSNGGTFFFVGTGLCFRL